MRLSFDNSYSSAFGNKASYTPFKIRFKVNILSVNPSETLDLIDHFGDNPYRNKIASLFIPGYPSVLHHGDIFEVLGPPALNIRRAFSSGIINDYKSQPLIFLGTAPTTTAS